MSDATPTRSALLELKQERQAMQEGHVFLDEKCLLLAGEMLRQLARHDELRRALVRAHEAAAAALRAAIARHGVEGVEVHPAADLEGAELRTREWSLMGVRLQDAQWQGVPGAPSAAVNPSPEATACRDAYLEVVRQAAPLAAVTGNLERLHAEYRRASRRARALQDVLLPELDRAVREIDARLEELEQEDALQMRRGVDASKAAMERAPHRARAGPDHSALA